MNVRPLPLLLLLAVPGRAEWRKLASANFELYTDGGERSGREALLRLEQIRHVFLGAAGSRRHSPLPVRVFLFASERDFRPFRPSPTTQGFYQGGPDREYIAMLARGSEIYRVVFHEYVHLVLNHSSIALPRWLEEGTAEFYSTLRAGEGKLHVGLPVAEHLRILSRQGWLDAPVLAGITKESEYYNEAGKAGLFYAQSWALVHMLNLAPGYRERIADYAKLLEQAAPPPLAFEQAFSKNLAAALDDLRVYLSQASLPAVEVSWNPPPPLSFLGFAVSDDEAELAILDLLLAMRKGAEAEKRIARLRRRGVAPATLAAALGSLALVHNRKDAARRHFQRAVELGDASADTWFELAMLERERGAGLARVQELLSRTIALNPNHAEAHFLLGLLASQDGRLADAAESMRKAAAILPRQSSFWHSLALTEHKLGRRQAAAQAALTALRTAATSQEEERAQAALRLASGSGDPAAPADRPAVITPKSWEPRRGDTTLKGILEHIDCLGSSARFQVRSEGKAVLLLVHNPGDVLLRTASGLTFEFRCGEQKPRPVIVEYLSRPDPARNTAGDITAIEFP